eukprot:m51a1_g3407 putative myotubularin isoform x1 (1148) ;mRNA; f:559739-564043
MMSQALAPGADDDEELSVRIASMHAVENGGSPYTIAPLATPTEAELLPGRRPVGNMEPGFVRQRMQRLQAYLSAVVLNPEIVHSSLLATFLDPNISPALVTIKDVLKEGFLDSQESVGSQKAKVSLPGVKTWRHRWCVLSARTLCLYVFKSREPYATPKSSLELSYCSVEPFRSKGAFCLKIQRWYEEHSLTLRAANSRELFDWISALQLAVTERSKDRGNSVGSSAYDVVARDLVMKLKLQQSPQSNYVSAPAPAAAPAAANPAQSIPQEAAAPEQQSQSQSQQQQQQQQDDGDDEEYPTNGATVAPEMEQPLGRYVALYDYAARDDTELTFTRGDIVEVVYKEDSGWWWGVLKGRRGWLPSNFFEEAPPEEAVPRDAGTPASLRGPQAKSATSAKSFDPSPLEMSAGPQCMFDVDVDDDIVPAPATSKCPPATPEQPPPGYFEDVSLSSDDIDALGMPRAMAESLKSVRASLMVRPPSVVSITLASLLGPDHPETKGCISERTCVADVKQQLARVNQIPANQLDRYGMFLNEFWLEEDPALRSFHLKPTDTLSMMRMKKFVSQTMQVTAAPTNLKVVARAQGLPSTAPRELPVKLCPGERVIAVLPNIVHVHVSAAPTATSSCVIGSFVVSNYRLFFCPTELPEGLRARTSSCGKCALKGFEVPVASLESMAKCKGISAVYGNFTCVVLRAKDFHDVRFAYLQDREVCPDDVLDRLLFHTSFEKLFAFTPEWVASYDQRALSQFWNLYNPITEFRRIGVPSEQWRLSRLNERFSYCATYPQLLCVPAAFSDRDLEKVFFFRSKGRIPVLTWLHPHNGAALLRCGQPSVGIANQRCPEDERLIEAVGQANGHTSTVSIIDARPRINAKANQFKGLGFEYEKYYPNCIVRFLGIENIHKMRKSESKLRELCLCDPEAVGPRRIEATKWLYHIQLILSGAAEIAQSVELGHTTVVHCSDGWDRTSQLTSLALLILDPYYRTLEGFAVMIEKEWASYGHMFARRNKHVPSREKQPDQSPVFLQFVDCVWQLMSHLPNAFEFNERLLLDMVTELHACRFGTFLFNSECEKLFHDARTKTVPFWALVWSHKQDYINAEYSRQMRMPSMQRIRGFSITLWTNYFMRWRNYHEPDTGSTFLTSWKQNQTWFLV